jgi:hypothetical protein
MMSVGVEESEAFDSGWEWAVNATWGKPLAEIRLLRDRCLSTLTDETALPVGERCPVRLARLEGRVDALDCLLSADLNTERPA